MCEWLPAEVQDEQGVKLPWRAKTLRPRTKAERNVPGDNETSAKETRNQPVPQRPGTAEVPGLPSAAALQGKGGRQTLNKDTQAAIAVLQRDQRNAALQFSWTRGQNWTPWAGQGGKGAVLDKATSSKPSPCLYLPHGAGEQEDGVVLLPLAFSRRAPNAQKGLIMKKKTTSLCLNKPRPCLFLLHKPQSSLC